MILTETELKTTSPRGEQQEIFSQEINYRKHTYCQSHTHRVLGGGDAWERGQGWVVCDTQYNTVYTRLLTNTFIYSWLAGNWFSSTDTPALLENLGKHLYFQ